MATPLPPTESPEFKKADVLLTEDGYVTVECPNPKCSAHVQWAVEFLEKSTGMHIGCPSCGQIGRVPR